MNPRVALDCQGNAVVIWDSLFQDGADIGVFLNRFDPTGTPLGMEQQVNVTVLGDQFLPHFAVGAGGDGVAVWESGGGQDGARYGVFARRYEGLCLFADGFESGDTDRWSNTVQ
jgi:hypothetical protein